MDVVGVRMDTMTLKIIKAYVTLQMELQLHLKGESERMREVLGGQVNQVKLPDKVMEAFSLKTRGQSSLV